MFITFETVAFPPRDATISGRSNAVTFKAD